ncbi:hypothetical protein BH24ACT22_BH24ACT22_09790 [soil metagenome]
MVQTIHRDELRAKIERGDDFVLAETLDRELYEQSHLPGAINIPLEEIGSAEEKIPDKETEIIVYCMSPI